MTQGLDPLPDGGREKRESLTTRASRKVLYTGIGLFFTAGAALVTAITAKVNSDEGADRAHRTDGELDAAYAEIREKVENLTLMAVANATEIRLLREFCPERRGRPKPPEVPRPAVDDLKRPLPATPAAAAKRRNGGDH